MMKKALIAMIFTTLLAVNALAQNGSKAEEEFPYVAVPDTVTTDESRFSYFVTHFWDKVNFTRPLTNIPKFLDAFETYIQAFAYAHPNVVVTSVRHLMNKAQVYTKNLEALVAASEYFLYNPMSQYVNDTAFTLFVQEFLKNKSTAKDMREYYSAKLAQISSCQLGSVIPSIDYTDLHGKKQSISNIDAKFLLIMIDDVADSGGASALTRVRLSTDSNINSFIENGDLKVLVLSDCKYSKEWFNEAKNYNSNWMVGTTDNFGNLDLRYKPCFYLLNKDKEFIYKHLTIDDVKAFEITRAQTTEAATTEQTSEND